MLDLRCGHVLMELAKLPRESVHCLVTSPPYWGLRSYKTEPQVWGGEEGHKHQWKESVYRSRTDVDCAGFKQATSTASRFTSTGASCPCGAWRGELGLEPTPELYVQHLIDVFREVRRVLRKDGTCWINLGSSYAGSWGNYGDRRGQQRLRHTAKYDRAAYDEFTECPPTAACDGWKPKDLVQIPFLVSEALRRDGWWLRSAITLCKLNPMPESVRDRPTNATEMMFLMTKSPHYFFDSEAVREPYTEPLNRWGGETKKLTDNLIGGIDSPYASMHRERKMRPHSSGRNLRNWWVVTTEPSKEAHFSTFGQKWIEPCIRAGTSSKGCCAKCGAPWDRKVDVSYEKNRPSAGNDPRSRNEDRLCNEDARGHGGWKGNSLLRRTETIDWHPTCSCHAERVPCTVLDPFIGSGTTALVALKLNRRCLGIDLKPAYIEMTTCRMEREVPLLARMDKKP